jgi:hypothetical protein
MMRTTLLYSALAALSTVACAGQAGAADGCCAAAPSCGCQTAAACGCLAGDPCEACNGNCGIGGLLGHLCGHHRNKGPRYEGLEAGFNCGCNGSYKFPVPPLYTYHWPGMLSAQLMTEYHSPWRFPPLKPYTDELPPVVTQSELLAPQVRTASAVQAQPLSFSQRIERMSR